MIAGLVLTGITVSAWRGKSPKRHVLIAAVLLGCFLVIDREARRTGAFAGVPVTSCVLGFRCGPDPPLDSASDCFD